MTRTATTVWLDGKLLDDDQLQLHALTHALHYGSSVFEGIRVYATPQGPTIFRLREHVDRLAAKAYWTALSPSPEFVIHTVWSWAGTPTRCRPRSSRRCARADAMRPTFGRWPTSAARPSDSIPARNVRSTS